MMNSKRWLGGWMHLLAFAVVFAVLGCTRGRSPAQKEDSQASAEEAGQKEVSRASTGESSEDRSGRNAEFVQSKTGAPDSSSHPQGVIALETRWENGVLTMPCKVNGLRLRFIFDTGASSVCISSTEALFMLKNGYLDEADIGGSSQAVIANGDIVDSTEIILREVEVGGIVLKNVAATVTHGLDAPLLFGQSAIQQLGTIQIRDGEVTIVQGGEQQLIVEEETNEVTKTPLWKQAVKNGWIVRVNNQWKSGYDWLPSNVKDENGNPQDDNLSNYQKDICDLALTLLVAYAGYEVGMWGIGYKYEVGTSIPQDFSEAFRWYRMAAERGLATAQFYVGVYLANGKGVRQNQAEARRWYAMAAAQGDVDAQVGLGIMYAQGQGGPEDMHEAANWFHRAAEQGQASAQSILAMMYHNGEGVTKNMQQAVYWYQKAAEQDDAGALNNLAFLYEEGIGVAKNKRKALLLYKRAADIGSDEGEHNYRRLLLEKEAHDREVERRRNRGY